MGEFVNAYIAGLECLVRMKAGSRKQVGKSLQFFHLLNEAERAWLEAGTLPPPSSISRLAGEARVSLEECEDRLSNFLYWRTKSMKLKQEGA
jgi:hypothetical protein